MESKLLEYYNRELVYLREMGADFAERYPKVAGRLGMQGIEVNDPYVERLLEGFAFLTSRIQLKMDAEFPRFSQRVLEVIYPNYLAPIPSMAIAELHPDGRKGNINTGFLVPRGTMMTSDSFKKSGITCKYRTAHDVMLYPLSISQVSLGAAPGDIANVAGIDRDACQSALRIRLRLDDNVTLDNLRLDKLTFYLSGPDIEAMQLLELVMQHTTGILCQSTYNPRQWQYLSKEQLNHEGFEADQALLPNDLRNFDGYRLLQEYFAFPARFRFISISGLTPLFSMFPTQSSHAKEFEIVLLLDKALPALAKRIDTSHLSLHCTPVVNLFPKVAERITLNNKTNEYHLVVDNIQPLDYEVFSVQRLWGTPENNQYEQEFRPFYCTQGRDGQNYGAYFSLRRSPRPLSAKSKRHGTRSTYLGSEVFLSLVDANHTPWRNDLEYFTAEVLVTNRDLPLLLQKQELLSFIVSDSIPLRQVTLRTPPSLPREALAEGRLSWGLISQLQLDYVSLMEGDEAQSTRMLRELLTLYAKLEEPQVIKEINGVQHCRLTPTYQRSPFPGPIVFSRGIAIGLTVDEQAFSGGTPYLFGCVLERLFSRIVTMNSFVTTSLSTPQRGKIAQWPPRIGRRTLI
ncbi:type VI secretion system baseplate subunit TssF [Serratia sp. DD3]|uniref:type VI secretion system baseplate subunit TssF n=1 Tax=Serratia sp. DD3 TaxID=1410619 RepID=UPI0003C4F068|nr:type VI secretion system baseplate subunit TssF [Serratia sp. DD3]KEY58761.1 type VI secretion protein, family [Serratia sp. DD3]